jgi:uncharacterized membrane protein YhaH (DUF805 family)
MTWIWVFLSFRGRLSAKRFRKAGRILAPICLLPIWYGLLVGFSTREGWIVNRLLQLAFILAAIWPMLALTIKRLNDSDREQPILFGVLATLALPGAFALGIAVETGVIGPPASCAIWSIVGALAIVALIFDFKIAKLRGTTGPNRFGPESMDSA